MLKNKSKFISMVCFLALTFSTLCSMPVWADGTDSINGSVNNATITVNGTGLAASKQLSILVLGANDVEDGLPVINVNSDDTIGSFKFIDQCTTDENGAFTSEFSMSDYFPSGDYIIWIGNEDGGALLSESFTYNSGVGISNLDIVNPGINSVAKYPLSFKKNDGTEVAPTGWKLLTVDKSNLDQEDRSKVLMLRATSPSGSIDWTQTMLQLKTGMNLASYAAKKDIYIIGLYDNTITGLNEETVKKTVGIVAPPSITSFTAEKTEAANGSNEINVSANTSTYTEGNTYITITYKIGNGTYNSMISDAVVTDGSYTHTFVPDLSGDYTLVASVKSQQSKEDYQYAQTGSVAGVVAGPDAVVYVPAAINGLDGKIKVGTAYPLTTSFAENYTDAEVKYVITSLESRTSIESEPMLSSAAYSWTPDVTGTYKIISYVRKSGTASYLASKTKVVNIYPAEDITDINLKQETEPTIGENVSNQISILSRIPSNYYVSYALVQKSPKKALKASVYAQGVDSRTYNYITEIPEGREVGEFTVVVRIMDPNNPLNRNSFVFDLDTQVGADALTVKEIDEIKELVDGLPVEIENSNIQEETVVID